jgi:hypothetical protein
MPLLFVTDSKGGACRESSLSDEDFSRHCGEASFGQGSAETTGMAIPLSFTIVSASLLMYFLFALVGGQAFIGPWRLGEGGSQWR